MKKIVYFLVLLASASIVYYLVVLLAWQSIGTDYTVITLQNDKLQIHVGSLHHTNLFIDDSNGHTVAEIFLKDNNSIPQKQFEQDLILEEIGDGFRKYEVYGVPFTIADFQSFHKTFYNDEILYVRITSKNVFNEIKIYSEDKLLHVYFDEEKTYTEYDVLNQIVCSQDESGKNIYSFNGEVFTQSE